MKRTAPVHVLKGKAKKLKRDRSITMTQALDIVAQAEGYNSWSLLQAKATSPAPRTAGEVLDDLHPGDMLLVGARPGLGKTTFALRLLLRAVAQGRAGWFFSLEYTPKTFAEKLNALEAGADGPARLIRTDFADGICADHIIRATEKAVTPGAVIAVDYLQLLDQQRDKPSLQRQVEDLKAYARAKRCSMVFLSQIDRAIEEEGRNKPGLADVRLPNPLDLGLFNKVVFVENGRIHA